MYYKRNDTRKWRGPGTVIGHDSSNVLIKHGAHYVRVHPCRVILDKKTEKTLVKATEGQDIEEHNLQKGKEKHTQEEKSNEGEDEDDTDEDVEEKEKSKEFEDKEMATTEIATNQTNIQNDNLARTAVPAGKQSKTAPRSRNTGDIEFQPNFVFL